MTIAQRLTNHINAVKALREMRKRLDPAAGLSLRICQGPMDADNAHPVDVGIVYNETAVLDAIIAGLDQTSNDTMRQAAAEWADIAAAMRVHDAYVFSVATIPARAKP